MMVCANDRGTQQDIDKLSSMRDTQYEHFILHMIERTTETTLSVAKSGTFKCPALYKRR
jgi:hypothetical protein